MRSPDLTFCTQTNRQTETPQSRLIAGLADGFRWMARKLAEQRRRSAVMELSDDQLKDIGLSRGQIESDVHVSSHYWNNKGL
ncbi:uncharacterized protein YjiS (DUF1127 family) [Rhizobium sp. BK529]|uniref:DUF1127 domain-containing protein n=1 Tax=unclassified Rhizobium TaxID=2613769 RepID=UPI00104D6163|nr:MULTISPECIES: DUF1127 domain-containing protein [unclassified Rhizobium]MBB3591917.1 uncharacterized protein YjiS (DUF1127 family) [Rhizobium sp. BK529]TCS08200.1 uncharacterized protein DUF1127 [Rhizobium sp. BK418]